MSYKTIDRNIAESIARGIVEGAGKTGNFSGYSGLDSEFLRREIAAAIGGAYVRGATDALSELERRLK